MRSFGSALSLSLLAVLGVAAPSSAAVNLTTTVVDFSAANPAGVCPVLVTHAGDASRRLFVLDKRGYVWQRDPANPTEVLATPFLNVAASVIDSGCFDEDGLLGLAFHPRYASNGLRVENRAALEVELKRLFGQVRGEAFGEELLRKGVPAAAILDVGTVAQAPHTLHRQMVMDEEGYSGPGIPVKLARTPGALRSTTSICRRSTRTAGVAAEAWRSSVTPALSAFSRIASTAAAAISARDADSRLVAPVRTK